MSEDFETKNARHKELFANVNGLRKAILFDVLAPAGITTITVEFDGGGDSGLISDISARGGDQPTQLPTTQVTIQQIRWGRRGGRVVRIHPLKLRSSPVQ